MAPESNEEIKRDDESSCDDRYRAVLVNARILVVDDSRPVRMVHKRTLEIAKAYADEADNGVLALAALRKAASDGKPYALVLTDLTMPEMSGLDLLKTIRQDPQLRTTRVVIASSASEKEKVLECAKYGISGYLVKPSKTKTILDTIGQALFASVASDKSSSSRSALEDASSSRLAAEIRDIVERIRREKNIAPPADPVGEAVLAFLSSSSPATA